MTQRTQALLERITAKIQDCFDGLEEAASIIIEQRERIRALEHQHRDLVLRNRLLRDRPDLPMERLVAYQDVVALFDDQAVTIAALKARLRACGLDEEAV